jgi:hypothetical protein
MSEITPILAATVAAVHCAVIFWPRKPLAGPKDENGFPIVWSNNNPEQQDVACTWPVGTEQTAPGRPAKIAIRP